MKSAPVFVICVLLASCANPELPPGTHPDRVAPQAEEFHPSYGEAIPGFDGDAWIQFDEPLSDPRSIERTMLMSPAGRYEVTPGRTRIRIRPEGGWRDGVVYFFSLPTGISDLLRNRTAAPIEMLFSTGTEVSATLVKGHAYDRVTGRGSAGIRLLFLSQDSVPYTAVSDTGGVFRLPGLPYGAYRAIAFIDQNRDFEYQEEFEPGDVSPFELTDTLATATVDLWMLPADSTPPILASAEIRDSLSVRIMFDDPLDPEASLADVEVSIQQEQGDRTWTVVDIVVGGPMVPVVTSDSVEVDAAPPVPVPQPARTSRPPASTFATVTVAESLIEGSYRIRTTGFPNLRGLTGGGDTSVDYTPPSPIEDEQ